MDEKKLFNQLDFARTLILHSIKDIPENLLDKHLEGAVNTLRWHIGHIFTSQALLCNKFIGCNVTMPSSYINLFAKNTNPSMWEITPPTFNELTFYLEKQPAEVCEVLAGRLEEKLLKPFKTGTHGDFTTVFEAIVFAIHHEGHHLGAINILKRQLGLN